MDMTQLELFTEYAKEQPPQNDANPLIIEIGDKRFSCSVQDIDRMEKKFGPYTNDDGVDFWWLLRQLKNDGVKCVTLI